MPFRNEHAARQLSPEQFVRFARKRIAHGVSAVLGIDRRGKAHVQSLRFNSVVFTPAEARSWLARCGFRTELEEARKDGSLTLWPA